MTAPSRAASRTSRAWPLLVLFHLACSTGADRRGMGPGADGPDGAPPADLAPGRDGGGGSETSPRDGSAPSSGTRLPLGTACVRASTEAAERCFADDGVVATYYPSSRVLAVARGGTLVDRPSGCEDGLRVHFEDIPESGPFPYASASTYSSLVVGTPHQGATCDWYKFSKTYGSGTVHALDATHVEGEATVDMTGAQGTACGAAACGASPASVTIRFNLPRP